VDEAFISSHVVQVISLSVDINGRSEAHSVLELLTPSGILLLQKVVQILVLSLLVLVNLSIVGNNFHKADVLLSNVDSLGTGALKLNLED